MGHVKKGVKGFISRPLRDRFMERFIVDSASSCWNWTGAKTEFGYGVIWREGKNRMATQIAWELYNNKPFPEGKMACHHCDNPACVNPEHIFVGTCSDNMIDSRDKGRLHAKPRPFHNQNAIKTHCIKGHEFTPENTKIVDSRRICLACEPRRKAAKIERQRTRRALCQK